MKVLHSVLYAALLASGALGTDKLTKPEQVENDIKVSEYVFYLPLPC